MIPEREIIFMENDKKSSNGVKKLGTYLLFGGALFFAVALVYISVGINKDARQDAASEQKNISKKAQIQDSKPAEKIQVFLFYNTQRCYSCVTIGKYVKETVEQNFQKELNSGKIEFKEINIDLPENKELANKFKAAGSSLFLNPIIDGRDNIKEDTQVWRLVSNEQAFIGYLSDMLKGMFGNEVSAQEKSDIVLYYGDGCPHCANVEKYIQENGIKNKISFEEKEVYENKENAEQMAEDASYCDIDVESFGVPFLWADGKCLMGDEDIIDFFKQKVNEN